MGRYHAILFDMDGTLLDTLTDMQDAVNHVLAAHGSHTRAVLKSFLLRFYSLQLPSLSLFQEYSV